MPGVSDRDRGRERQHKLERTNTTRARSHRRCERDHECEVDPDDGPQNERSTACQPVTDPDSAIGSYRSRLQARAAMFASPVAARCAPLLNSDHSSTSTQKVGARQLAGANRRCNYRGMVERAVEMTRHRQVN